jgi:hypothetical protein
MRAIEEMFRAERAKAYLWEYRYLDHFYVLKTQWVLDWLASLPQRTTFGVHDAFWMPMIPDVQERRTIINVLQAHHIIFRDAGTDLIEVTPKGREYIEWRGPVPPPPQSTATR